MKSFVKIVLPALMLTSLLVIGSQAYAQTKLSAQVPFDFVASNTQYPAGTYNIWIDDKYLLRIVGASLSRLVLAHPTVAVKETGASKLVFNCYGKACFLSAILLPERTTGVGITKSKAELNIQINAKQSVNHEVLLAED